MTHPTSEVRRDVPSPAVEGPEPVTSGRGRRRDVVTVVVGAVAVLAVVVLHFRPWQGGLVEEWGIRQAWQVRGFSAYADPAVFEMLIGRPLHLLWAYASLTVSGGSFVGLFALATALSLGQLLLAAWAVGMLTGSPLVRWSVALLVAMHPWWSAGATLRYLPAQVALLGAVAWCALAVRYLRTGRVWPLVVACVALLVGLLTYPAPAVAVGLGALGLATVVAPTWRRAVTLGLATGGTIAADAAWSLLVAPRLGATYESQLASAIADRNLTNALRGIVTALSDVPAVLVLLAGVAAVVVALGFAQALSQWRAWAMLGLVAASPLAGMAFYPSAFHLNSPEHVPQVVGLTAWLLLVPLTGAVGARPVLRAVVALVAGLLVAVSSIASYRAWTEAARAQQVLLDLAAERRPDVPPGEVLVVEDRSGRYGSLYLFLPPTLETAVWTEAGPGAPVRLCTPADVPRAPGVSSDDCAAYLGSGAATRLGSGTTPLGPVTFYAAPPIP